MKKGRQDRIAETLTEKPEWLTMDKILEYSKRMIAQEE